MLKLKNPSRFEVHHFYICCHIFQSTIFYFSFKERKMMLPVELWEYNLQPLY